MDELEGPWAVRPLELVRERGRIMLMLEDTPSEPLDRLLGVPMEMQSFLRLAIAVTAEITMLSIVLEKSNEDVHSDLWAAVRTVAWCREKPSSWCLGSGIVPTQAADD